MKVIKQGKSPEEKGTEIICPNCHSVLEYFDRDVVTIQSTKEYGKYIKVILCLVCNNQIDIEDSESKGTK